MDKSQLFPQKYFFSKRSGRFAWLPTFSLRFPFFVFPLNSYSDRILEKDFKDFVEKFLLKESGAQAWPLSKTIALCYGMERIIK